MKTIAAFVIIFISIGIFSQNKQYYSGTFTVGTFIPISDIKNDLETGFNFGIDLELRKKNYGVFINSNINFTKEYVNVVLFEYNIDFERRKFNIIEVNIGPRFYFGDMNDLNGNIDLGFGLYTGSYLNKLLWGPVVGAGFSYPVSKKLSIVLNSRLNVIGIDNGKPYLGIHFGIKSCL